MRAHYDLIGFDPRGISRSKPLRCFDAFDESLLAFPPFAFPIGGEQEAIEKATTEYLAHACRNDAEPDHSPHVYGKRGTGPEPDAPRRRRLETQLRRVFLWVLSGHGVRKPVPTPRGRLVVDGILDPVAWRNTDGDTPFSERLRSDAGAQATLDEFFRLCGEAGPSSCAFAPSSSSRFAAMADKLLETGGVVISDPEGNEFPFLVLGPRWLDVGSPV